MWNESLLPDVCASPIHLEVFEGDDAVVYTDKTGLPWCSACKYRGEFLDWGRRHGWPEIVYRPFERVLYALLGGHYFWHITATQGNEDRVLTLFYFLEAVEEVL